MFLRHLLPERTGQFQRQSLSERQGTHKPLLFHFGDTLQIHLYIPGRAIETFIPTAFSVFLLDYRHGNLLREKLSTVLHSVHIRKQNRNAVRERPLIQSHDME